MAHTPYHHGDLRAALVEAGLQLCRTGGADALTLREATRRVGVTPNAAYRHFADRRGLVRAVGHEVLERMADMMRERMKPIGPPDSIRDTRARLQAVGLGYIDFARAEPGWFDLAFFGPGHELQDPGETEVAPPFEILVGALDDYAAAGGIPAGRRAGAEWACWSAVHGFAGLVVHGPLRFLPDHEIDALAERTVTTVISGLAR